VNRLCAVLRANAPLAALVGYPTLVKEATQSTAQLVMWLSHYEPVDWPPDGSAA
jgi:translation elongation factor EF-G